MNGNVSFLGTGVSETRIKIQTPATEEEIAVIVAAVQALEEKGETENNPEIFNWKIYSKRSRHEPVGWENKHSNSVWALESRCF